ncbi:hypothetical protein CYMTET_28647 [Cymbomonas tetramitiformis]|uniref:RING-type domain-containing protein n=1 Tax=Cymbomonas tetramitiformis TaxID=36881 RepID=A0AAE0KVQ9_9CHLO|nr:hypothetical protein CYMTET_28647 [Cymbomonas tetramitiformis]
MTDEAAGKCSICKNLLSDPLLIPQCGHTYCKSCIEALPTAPAPLPTFQPVNRKLPRPQVAICPLCEQKQQWSKFELKYCIPNYAIVPANPESISDSVIDSSKTKNEKSSAERVSMLRSMGVPTGLAKLVDHQDHRVGMRIYILDNSGSTSFHDGKYLPSMAPGATQQPRMRSCTRWEEIKWIAIAQAEWNAKVQTPCSFYLLNPANMSGDSVEGRDFCGIDTRFEGKGSAETQITVLKKMLDSSGPRGVTPLAERIAAVHQRMKDPWAEGAKHSVGDALKLQNQNAFLVLVTDGLPTTSHSASPTRQAKMDMVQELRKLTMALPVYVVVRLCTDEDDVVEYWNSLDEEVEFSLDVLDDLEGESSEIYKKCNRWLNYCPLLHTIREGGTNVKLLDLVDERSFTGGEVAAFCQLLFMDDPETQEALLDWRDVDAFCDELQKQVDASAHVYSPLWKRHMPMVDVAQVRRVLRQDAGGRTVAPGSLQISSAHVMMAAMAVGALLLAMLAAQFLGDQAKSQESLSTHNTLSVPKGRFKGLRMLHGIASF